MMAVKNKVKKEKKMIRKRRNLQADLLVVPLKVIMIAMKKESLKRKIVMILKPILFQILKVEISLPNRWQASECRKLRNR